MKNKIKIGEPVTTSNQTS